MKGGGRGVNGRHRGGEDDMQEGSSWRGQEEGGTGESTCKRGASGMG